MLFGHSADMESQMRKVDKYRRGQICKLAAALPMELPGPSTTVQLPDGLTAEWADDPTTVLVNFILGAAYDVGAIRVHVQPLNKRSVISFIGDGGDQDSVSVPIMAHARI